MWSRPTVRAFREMGIMLSVAGAICGTARSALKNTAAEAGPKFSSREPSALSRKTGAVLDANRIIKPESCKAA